MLQELSFNESCLEAEILKITIDVFRHDSPHTKEVPWISPYLLCCGCQYRKLLKLSHCSGRKNHTDLKCDKIMQRHGFHSFLAHYWRTKSSPISLLVYETGVVWSLRCFMISGCCEVHKPKISKCWVICLLMPGSFIAPFPRHSLQKSINTLYQKYSKTENFIKVTILTCFWFSLASQFYLNFGELSTSHLKILNMGDYMENTLTAGLSEVSARSILRCSASSATISSTPTKQPTWQGCMEGASEAFRDVQPLTSSPYLWSLVLGADRRLGCVQVMKFDVPVLKV